MKKSILFLSAAVTLLAASSCQKFTKTDGGSEYKIVKDAGGPKAEAGDILAVDLTLLSDRNDSLINSTYTLGLPQIVSIAPDSIAGMQGTYKGDYNSMFKFFGEGDSAIFKLDLDTMAVKTSQPKLDFADKFVTIRVKVRKLFKKGQLTDSAMYAQVDTYFKNEIETIKKAETGKIENYISSKKLTPKKTASGLQYVVTEEGKGNKPALGDTVVVNYTGRLTNGTLFDTSVKEVYEKSDLRKDPMRTFEPIRFSLGNQPVIQGWTEALQLLNKGSKATLIIPSSIAYGERPMGDRIPPYAPLVFEIELVDVIKGQGLAAPQAPFGMPNPEPTN
jgi:FKBP-type peptidyl-prolyl cis-trans isomerase FkpA